VEISFPLTYALSRDDGEVALSEFVCCALKKGAGHARVALADDENPSRGDYEMKDPETRTVFAGVDGRSDAQLPNWYAEQKPVDEPVSFADAIRDLPRAVETTVAYQNPYSDEWIETDRFNAVVEPSRLREQAAVSGLMTASIVGLAVVTQRLGVFVESIAAMSPILEGI
jgi:hypothetical protein